MSRFVGLDWGSQSHSLCVVDESGRVCTKKEIPHDRKGLKSMLALLAEEEGADCLRIAIERPDGLLVDTLIDAGHCVVPILPVSVKASRSRYRACGSKSDAEDAYVLADILRTDGHRFEALLPPSDELRAVRALTRTRDDLVGHRVAIGNQLQALLESFWPGAVGLFSRLHSPIAMAFLKRYPTPKSAHRLGEKRMASFLSRQAYSGRRSAKDLVQHLQDAASGSVDSLEEATKGTLTLSLVAILEELTRQTRRLEKDIIEATATLPEAEIMRSFPRAGQINAAQIVAEIGDVPGRFQTDAQLAAYAGVAPVTKASGKYRNVSCRRACNKRLRRAITLWANNSRHASPWAQKIYVEARTRGCPHPHAIRILARAWLRVLWRCLKEVATYNPTKHKAAAALTMPSAA